MSRAMSHFFSDASGCRTQFHNEHSNLHMKWTFVYSIRFHQLSWRTPLAEFGSAFSPVLQSTSAVIIEVLVTPGAFKRSTVIFSCDTVNCIKMPDWWCSCCGKWNPSTKYPRQVTEPALWFSYRAFKGPSSHSSDIICSSCHLKIRKRVDRLKRDGKADPNGFVEYTTEGDHNELFTVDAELPMDLSETDAFTQACKHFSILISFHSLILFSFFYHSESYGKHQRLAGDNDYWQPLPQLPTWFEIQWTATVCGIFCLCFTSTV